MKIGLCAWSFSGKHREAGREPDPHQPQGLLALAQRYGLASIEGASGWFEGMDPGQIDAFRSDLGETGVFVDTGGQDYAEDLTPLTSAVASASRVGSPVVRTTISGLLEGDRRSLGRDGWNDHLAALVEPLQRAADAAREAGIVIGIENHQDICSHELVGLCQQIGGDHIGVTMDVGNAYAVGETPATFARRVGPFLKHVHLKDYTVHPTKSGYRLKRCALGDGIVDWKSMLPWFDSQCPLVAGCIELGATSARHIRLFEPGWWQTYPERDFVPDAIEALGDLQRAAQPSATDWRTPHEAGESAPVCADYEIDQIERSVAYLKEIGAV
ncbi:MAG: sugar phosphate isomerase/epimerase [Candidatus Latescibacteria bacterium]|nr:sugar phosphate isomerase/epimerase [Candidatus Latescibacterota bacterium]